jgi:hypothetical protein
MCSCKKINFTFNGMKCKITWHEICFMQIFSTKYEFQAPFKHYVELLCQVYGYDQCFIKTQGSSLCFNDFTKNNNKQWTLNFDNNFYHMHFKLMKMNFYLTMYESYVFENLGLHDWRLKK